MRDSSIDRFSYICYSGNDLFDFNDIFVATRYRRTHVPGDLCTSTTRRLHSRKGRVERKGPFEKRPQSHRPSVWTALQPQGEILL